MVRTVRLLVEEMEKENMAFPLHLGVTEAGDGEDGRIKSSLGIGALLADGLGATKMCMRDRQCIQILTDYGLKVTIGG